MFDELEILLTPPPPSSIPSPSSTLLTFITEDTSDAENSNMQLLEGREAIDVLVRPNKVYCQFLIPSITVAMCSAMLAVLNPDPSNLIPQLGSNFFRRFTYAFAV